MGRKIYNVVPQAEGGTFINNYPGLRLAKAKAQEWANCAGIDTAVYANRPRVDKIVCMMHPQKGGK